MSYAASILGPSYALSQLGPRGLVGLGARMAVVGPNPGDPGFEEYIRTLGIRYPSAGDPASPSCIFPALVGALGGLMIGAVGATWLLDANEVKRRAYWAGRQDERGGAYEPPGWRYTSQDGVD